MRSAALLAIGRELKGVGRPGGNRASFRRDWAATARLVNEGGAPSPFFVSVDSKTVSLFRKFIRINTLDNPWKC